MSIKGKAKFELTNVETGEQRVIEEENMITNAFQYLVQGNGIYRGDIQSKALSVPSSDTTAMSGTSYHTNLLRKLTNGLVLFSDKLEEDPDHIFITADDPEVTGVGADLAYIGSQTCAGSYNKTESGSIENGYKYVWDFTTSQANGDIGCACLTNTEGAGLGFGLPTSVSDWRGRHNYFNGTYNLYLPIYDDYSCIGRSVANGIYVDESKNTMVRLKDYFSIPYCNSSYGSNYSVYVSNEFDVNGKVFSQTVFNRTFIAKKSIDFNVYRCPFNNVSIFDNLNTTSKTIQLGNNNTTTQYYRKMKLLKTVTVNMPSDLAALIPDDIVQASSSNKYLWATACNIDEGFMYISFVIPTAVNTTPYLNSGDKLYTWKINMETFESTWFSITNTTGQKLTLSTSTFFSTYPFVTVSNNYTVLYTSAGYGNAWIIDNATGTTIKQMVNSDDAVVSVGQPDRGIFIRDDMVHFLHYNTYTNQVLNLKTGVLKYTYSGTNITSEYGYCSGITHGTKCPKILTNYLNTWSSSYSAVYLNEYIDPQILMTINNLENIVTKTSAETMKVTYIITESEE